MVPRGKKKYFNTEHESYLWWKLVVSYSITMFSLRCTGISPGLLRCLLSGTCEGGKAAPTVLGDAFWSKSIVLTSFLLAFDYSKCGIEIQFYPRVASKKHCLPDKKIELFRKASRL